MDTITESDELISDRPTGQPNQVSPGQITVTVTPTDDPPTEGTPDRNQCIKCLLGIRYRYRCLLWFLLCMSVTITIFVLSLAATEGYTQKFVNQPCQIATNLCNKCVSQNSDPDCSPSSQCLATTRVGCADQGCGDAGIWCSDSVNQKLKDEWDASTPKLSYGDKVSKIYKGDNYYDSDGGDKGDGLTYVSYMLGTTLGLITAIYLVDIIQQITSVNCCLIQWIYFHRLHPRN